jgi:hypothetical protein
MNPHKQGYTKKLGDTLRENEALKAKIAALEAACTYDVMRLACSKCFGNELSNQVVQWEQCVLESLKETNTPNEIHKQEKAS